MAEETFDDLIPPSTLSGIIGPVASSNTGEFQKSHHIAGDVDEAPMSWLLDLTRVVPRVKFRSAP